MLYQLVVDGKEIPEDVAEPLITLYYTIVKEMEETIKDTTRDVLRAEVRGYFQGVALALHVNSLYLENAVRFYVKQERERSTNS